MAAANHVFVSFPRHPVAFVQIIGTGQTTRLPNGQRLFTNTCRNHNKPIRITVNITKLLKSENVEKKQIQYEQYNKKSTHKIIAFEQRTSRRNTKQQTDRQCNVLCCKIKLIHSSECCTNNVNSIYTTHTQRVTVSDLIMFYWQVNIFMPHKYVVSVWNNYLRIILYDITKIRPLSGCFPCFVFRQARIIRELYFSRFRQLLSNLKLQFPLTMKRFYDKKSPKLSR